MKTFFVILSWIKGTVCAKHRNRDQNALSQSLTALPAPSEKVVAVGDWGSFPPATQKTPAGADVFVWYIIFYNFPHCLPVKKRRVVVARNTFPARSTVVGNSGWEGLQG